MPQALKIHILIYVSYHRYTFTIPITHAIHINLKKENSVKVNSERPTCKLINYPTSDQSALM